MTTSLRPLTTTFALASALALSLSPTFPFAFSRAEAAKLGDVAFDDALDFEGRKFILNGLGLRKFAIFKVYVGGLYLEKKSGSAEEILGASQTHRVLKLRFLRDVGVKDIRKAWAEGFEKNCSGAACASMKPEVEALNALMEDCKEGQTVQFSFSPESVAIWHEGVRKGEVKKAGFADQVLAIFIGKNPPGEALKDGLLGK